MVQGLSGNGEVNMVWGSRGVAILMEVEMWIPFLFMMFRSLPT